MARLREASTLCVTESPTGSGNRLVVQSRTRDRNLELSSPESSICVDSYFGIRSNPVLPHVMLKGHSAKSETHMHPTYVASNKVNW